MAHRSFIKNLSSSPLSKFWQLKTIFHFYYANQCIVSGIPYTFTDSSKLARDNIIINNTDQFSQNHWNEKLKYVFGMCQCSLGGSIQIFLTDLNAAPETTSTWTYGDHCSGIISWIEYAKKLLKTIKVFVVKLKSAAIALNSLFWPKNRCQMLSNLFTKNFDLKPKIK